MSGIRRSTSRYNIRLIISSSEAIPSYSNAFKNEIIQNDEIGFENFAFRIPTPQTDDDPLIISHLGSTTIDD